MSSAQVYAASDPTAPRAMARPPTMLLHEWIERWLALKVDVAATTYAEYARILRGRITASLGDLSVAEITRYEHRIRGRRTCRGS